MPDVFGPKFDALGPSPFSSCLFSTRCPFLLLLVEQCPLALAARTALERVESISWSFIPSNIMPDQKANLRFNVNFKQNSLLASERGISYANPADCSTQNTPTSCHIPNTPGRAT